MTAVAWLLAGAVLGTPGEPKEEDWDWLSKHRFVAFESLMPVGHDPRAWVTYFSYRDLYQDVHEGYFKIRTVEGTSSFPEAVVIAPVERSIQQQLLEMHMTDRGLPFESVLASVKVRVTTLSAGTCPAVRESLSRVMRLRFRLPHRDVIVLHPTVHRVLVEFGGGNIDFSLAEDGHEVARWAQRTLAELQRCGTER